MALRQVGDRRLVEPFAGGTSVEQQQRHRGAPPHGLEHLIALSRELQDRGVDLVVLDQGIDTSTAVAGCSSRYSARSPNSSTP